MPTWPAAISASRFLQPCRCAAWAPDRPWSPARAGHGRRGLSRQERTVRGCWEGGGGQVGPGGWRAGPPAVGKLQDEPWRILPPEVVHHGGEDAADGMAAIFQDTNPSSANV